MENNIRKTIGIILMIAGAIILLSSLGILNLKFFAIAETTISSYDGKYVHIPFSAIGSSGDVIEVIIKPTAVLPENICNNIGTYSQGSCIITCEKILALKDYIVSDASKCGENIKIYKFDYPQDVVKAYVYWAAQNVTSCQPEIVIYSLPPYPISCSGEILFEVTPIIATEPAIPPTTQPVCTFGQEKCEGATSFACENNEWINKGKVIGKCGYSGSAITPEQTPSLPVETTEPKKPLNFVFVITGSIIMIGGIFMVVKNGR